MKERPILFSRPMVRAILRGEKTCTRRVVTLPQFGSSATPGYDWTWRGIAPVRSVAQQARHPHGCWQDMRHADVVNLCPYGVPGNLLWVRETWQTCTTPEDRDISQVVYAADHDGRPGFAEDEWAWRPSIFMPRWAARIELQITSVTMERLHAISADDIVAEGVRVPVDRDGHALVRVGGANSPLEFLDPTKPRTAEDHLRAEWAALWCGINGRASWDANPWVWVVRFERAATATP